MDPKDRAYLLRRLRRFYEPDKLEAVFNAAGPIPPGEIKLRPSKNGPDRFSIAGVEVPQYGNSSPKGASIEEIAGKPLKQRTRLVRRRTAFAEALEQVGLITKLRALDRGEQALRPEAAKVLRELQAGLERAASVRAASALAPRGQLRDLFVAKIERGKPPAFSGADWLDETVDRLRLFKCYAGQVMIPPSPSGHPREVPPDVMLLIHHMWRDVLGQRRSRTVGVTQKNQPDVAEVKEDNIPHGPLIDFAKACLALVGFELSADAVNSQLSRSKWAKPSAE